MDINQQLQPIITGMIQELKAQINAELRQQLSSEIVKTLAATELTSIISQAVSSQVNARLERFDFAGTGEQELQKSMRVITDQVNKNLSASANKQIVEYVNQKLDSININESVTEVVQRAIGDNLKGTTFPEASIHHSSVNFQGLQITGDNIVGGIISNFGSTGIEDRATHVQMTLLDHAVVFEEPLYGPELNVTGNTVVNGSFVLHGEFDHTTSGFKKLISSASLAVQDNLNAELFSSFSDIIFDKIQVEGLDLNKITQGGREVINGNQLGYHITDTNIQRVGVLNDLQTSGENLFVDTLYVTQNRIGVNTMDPSTTVSIWDQEVEIVVNKHSQDTGYIGTGRNQKLIVGSNNKQNITLDPDGSVQVSELVVGTTSMISVKQVPNYVGKPGQIAWNSAPRAGSPIGWVCLGETLWANFGRIENS